ncbi:amino acid/amide ABC transporter ATP-binding protein 1 (HAAT family) [Breoghania corrubedonensis]|uniref:Amino acid/amide ABC transporter ATP-binding protein 1 (HAAT family) n=1 Tax=Breoghania corrubedonensis TaxID=665038 RepID=A0A2T5V7Q7_9HYPH|nr:ABC transporter ATP-binding protein [Breoghania corrubedonensis]PTW59795.1 amino acid/amide ABC transporter ATP-binding protein 1 (HAAT family) [Breoghania corrubedonensis]
MAEPVLQIRGLCKHFGALRASDNVDLDLMPGEIHALIGPNGAGKSTLIKQIAGEIAPDAGTIRLAGRDVTASGAVARARLGLARSFQVSSVAGEFTVLQNVMLAVAGRLRRTYRFLRPALADTKLTAPAREAIARVGLADREGMRAADLSHGERRTLEIAIALALKPKAFLLDEPMAGMGPEGARSLTHLLDGLRHEAPILLVEHDMDAVFALADRISVLVHGRIIASGTVAEIQADAVVRAAYLGEEDA